MPGVQERVELAGAVEGILCFFADEHVARLRRGKKGWLDREAEVDTSESRGQRGRRSVWCTCYVASSPPQSFVREQSPLMYCGARILSQVHLHIKNQGPVEGDGAVEELR